MSERTDRYKWFRGESDEKIGDDGSLILPERFLDVIDEIGDDRLMVVLKEKLLNVYPFSDWIKFIRKMFQQEKIKKDPLVFEVMDILSQCTFECPIVEGKIFLPPDLCHQLRPLADFYHA